MGYGVFLTGAAVWSRGVSHLVKGDSLLLTLARKSITGRRWNGGGRFSLSLGWQGVGGKLVRLKN